MTDRIPSKSFISLNDPSLAPIVNDLPQTMITIQNYNQRLKDLRTALVPTMNSIEINSKNFENLNSENFSKDEKNLEKNLENLNLKNEFFVNNGISFLQLRTQLLTQYNINLLQYMTLRTDGRKIKDHPCVGRMVHLRLLLERIKPITTQLQYQIDQILQQATTSTIIEKKIEKTIEKEENFFQEGKKNENNNNENFNIAEFSHLTKEQITAQKKAEYRERVEENKKNLKDQDLELKRLNQSLKFSKNYGDDDDDEPFNMANVGDDAASQWHANELKIQKKQEKKDKIKDKALYTTLVKQLREELTERPMEESSTGLSMHKYHTREQKERMEFEEENFIRLQDNKQERKKQRRTDRLQGMDDIEDSADYREIYKFDMKQQVQREREKAMRDYEAGEAKEKLMGRIETNVRKNYSKNSGFSDSRSGNQQNQKRKKPFGGFRD